MTLLSLSDLSATLGGAQVVDRVSVDLGSGEFVGLLGPNGAGKSTLLRAIMGLVDADGRVVLAGRDASSLSAKDRAKAVAYLPQEREIAWSVPVEMLVSLGRAPYRSAFSPLGAADCAAIEEAMLRMDVTRFRDRAATELSGGELARVLMARALAQDTALLLADEPASGLDPAHQIALMRIFVDLARQGRTVVASLHDLGLAARWCSRLLLLDRGRIVADGAPEKVLTPEHLRAVYGVTSLSTHTPQGWMVQPLDLVDRAGENG